MTTIQEFNFYWIQAILSKVMGIYVKFYHDHSPNMVMSCDPGCKFWKLLFFAWFYIRFQEKLPSLLSELAQEQKSYRQKLIRLSFLIIHKKQKAFDNFHFLVSCLCSVMTQVTETGAVNPPFLAVRLPVLEAASQSPYSNRNLSIYLKIISFQA